MTFGNNIEKGREVKVFPLRKVAAHLVKDTPTLSKIERGERPVSPNYLKPIAEILELNLKEVQTHFIADKINKYFGCLEHLTKGLKEAGYQLKRSKK